MTIVYKIKQENTLEMNTKIAWKLAEELWSLNICPQDFSMEK